MSQGGNHIIWLHGTQTGVFVNHAMNQPSGQSDVLLLWNKSLQVQNTKRQLVKQILITRLDTFRFGNISDEEVLKILRHEIMYDSRVPIDSENLEKINQSLHRATNYLNDKWYPLPRNIPRTFKNEDAIISWIKNQRKSTDGYMTRNTCRFLQVVNAYHTLLSTPGVQIDDEWEIDIRNKELMNGVMDAFSDPSFRYKDTTKKLSRTTNEAEWNFITQDWWHWNIPFYARFRLKYEQRGVQKFIQNPEYDVKALLQDMHGLRIEVSDPAHAFKMMEYVLSRLNLWGAVTEIKNRLMCTSDEWNNWCAKQFFSKEFRDLMNQKAQFWAMTKSSSAERRELKFSCKDPSFEVQFVLVNNHNETAYAHHDIYGCVCDIFEKIRFDGYCNTEDIDHFIRISISDKTKEETWLTLEHIRKYIVSKLIPIRFSDVHERKAQYTTIASVFRMAMGDLANIRDCILEFPAHGKKLNAKWMYGKYAWMKVAVKDLEFTPELMALIDDEKDENSAMRVEIRRITSGSSTAWISSPTPRQGQWFVMDDSAKKDLDWVLATVKNTTSSQ